MRHRATASHVVGAPNSMAVVGEEGLCAMCPPAQALKPYNPTTDDPGTPLLPPPRSTMSGGTGSSTAVDSLMFSSVSGTAVWYRPASLAQVMMVCVVVICGLFGLPVLPSLEEKVCSSTGCLHVGRTSVTRVECMGSALVMSFMPFFCLHESGCHLQVYTIQQKYAPGSASSSTSASLNSPPPIVPGPRVRLVTGNTAIGVAKYYRPGMDSHLSSKLELVTCCLF